MESRWRTVGAGTSEEGQASDPSDWDGLGGATAAACFLRNGQTCLDDDDAEGADEGSLRNAPPRPPVCSVFQLLSVREVSAGL